nr:hypothetical protein [Deltaproteobacteria bacterium]
MSISVRISLLTLVLTVFLAGSVSAEFPIGDLTGDCDVNSLDLQIFVGQWLDPSGCLGHPDDCADFDGINGINSADFALLAANWLIKTGSLQVTILPPEAAAAGAQWRVDGGEWRDSGYTETCVPVGTHTIECKPIPDWNEPNSRTVQINDDQTTTTSQTYVRQTGSLQVTILPSVAVTAGAQWRVDGGAWRDSDYKENGLSVGSHTIEYSTVAGWDTPASEVVQINNGITTTTIGTYTQQTGSLQVAILPPEAIAAGAKWQVDSDGIWRDSGDTKTGLTVGSHTVEYSTVTGWNKPADEIVQISDGLTTTTTGTYTQQTGSLQVTISPQAAIDAGAQWRVDGGAWRDSDYTETGLTVGSHTVEYSTVAGWNKPADEIVQISDGLTTTTTGTYTQQTGYLQVTISPQGAIDAGAQWRVDGGAWRDSDYIEAGLAVGSHTVEYSTVAGWDTPANETVQINDGLTTTTTGTYVQQTGSLQVAILPQGAIDAGAQWRVDNRRWRDSNYIETGLSAGLHTVRYKDISGWGTPAEETVQISDGLTTTTTGTYVQQTGSLQVTISPQAAVDAGAQWRVDGGAWRDNGYTETDLTVGSHTVEYSTVAGWDTPAEEIVQINDGLTTTTTGTYVQQTGSLQVTISPQAAIDAGAQWRVDGGAWRDSDYTETGLTVGSHTVEYSTVAGWSKPADEIVQINDGLTTTTTGTYVQQTGSLQVTISPPGAVTAGAQWRVDGGAWRNSDYTESGLTVGSHTVEYSTVAGWDKPADEIVQINDGLTTTTTGTYTQQTGSLQVTISPPGAVTAGAQWRVDGGAWRDSDYIETGLAVGSHTVEYKTITGWDTPANEVVQINDGLTTTTTGTYTQQTGSLQVTISPPGAVTAGAQWRVDGGAWRDSDYTESGLTVGSHTVEYSTVAGWDTPSNEIVQINDGLTTTTTGTYTQQTGYLQVTISPPGAVTAGAQWRVDGGAWRDSDYTESG